MTDPERPVHPTEEQPHVHEWHDNPPEPSGRVLQQCRCGALRKKPS